MTEIDQALAEHRIEQQVRAYYESLMPQVSAYEMIQAEIDQALAEHRIEELIRASYADLAASLT